MIDENGCEAFDTIEIAQLDEIMINLIQVPPSCNGLTDGQVGVNIVTGGIFGDMGTCLLYTSPSPRDRTRSRMPSSA